MVKRFWKFALLYRFFGCLFISGIRKGSVRMAKVKVAPYIFYSVLWFGVGMGYQAAFIIGGAFMRSGLSHSLTKSLIFIVHTVVTVKIFLTFLCMVTGSSTLLKFLRESEAYEKSTSFVPNKDPKISRNGWLRRFRRLVIVVAWVLCYAACAHLFTSLMASGNKEVSNPILKIIGFVSLFVYVLHDTTLYAVLSCSSDVLTEYVHHQLVSFTTCMKAQPANCELHSANQFEQIRLNLSKINNLKLLMEQMWHPAMASSSACLMLVLCVTLYTVFDDGFGQPDAWLSLAYSLCSSASFLDLAVGSQAMQDEAQKLKDAVRFVNMMEAADVYNRQIQYLHDTIEPDIMCLSGGGFFCLNKALLVSMAGSVITYAVILVQTSDELAEHVDVSKLVSTI
ncbi:uncharacterized protein LOC144173647 isoform X1 [Haemaphysalis longicornis]